MNSNYSCRPEMFQSEPNRPFFSQCDLEIRWMASKNNRAPLLCHFKLCALFRSHLWIQTEIPVREHSIHVQIMGVITNPYHNISYLSLQQCRNECHGVPNHQPHDCLLNRLFRRRSKITSKLHVTGLCAGNSPVTSEFPAQRASNTESVSIWWRHHV